MPIVPTIQKWKQYIESKMAAIWSDLSSGSLIDNKVRVE